MLNEKTTIVTKLKLVDSTVPVYYENAVESVTLPCITYTEIDNRDAAVGSTIAYSNLKIQVKVWGTELSRIMTLATAVDSKMRELGFRRTYSTEITANEVIQKVLQYEALGLENL